MVRRDMGGKKKEWIRTRAKKGMDPNQEWIRTRAKKVRGGEENEGKGWGGQKADDGGLGEYENNAKQCGRYRRGYPILAGLTNHYAESAHNRREHVGSV